MPYEFAVESRDYTDYASGAVFHGAPGHPAFPVRLTSEIFQRCRQVREAGGATGRPILYDPVCGAAYHLGTLAYLHWNDIDSLIGSDVDPEILTVAERNLSLLTVEGLDQRIAEIEAMLARYGKASHAAALASARRLRERRLALGVRVLPTRLFRADATDGAALRNGLAGTPVDMVIADVPYGQHAVWRSAQPAGPPPARPLWAMLEALKPMLAPGAVVAIAADKGQRGALGADAHAGYRRADRFQIGKRLVVLLQSLPG